MKQRLDILLTGQIPGLSREKAKALIMEGKVFVDGEREDKNRQIKSKSMERCSVT